jgi:MoaD family protein
MIVRFYATLRPIVGGRTVELPGTADGTVSELLDRLVAAYPQLKDHVFEPDGTLAAHVHVIVNGRDIVHLPDKIMTPLRGDEKIDIFPPVAGGA